MLDVTRVAIISYDAGNSGYHSDASFKFAEQKQSTVRTCLACIKGCQNFFVRKFFKKHQLIRIFSYSCFSYKVFDYWVSQFNINQKLVR